MLLSLVLIQKKDGKHTLQVCLEEAQVNYDFCPMSRFDACFVANENYLFQSVLLLIIPFSLNSFPLDTDLIS